MTVPAEVEQALRQALEQALEEDRAGLEVAFRRGYAETLPPAAPAETDGRLYLIQFCAAPVFRGTGHDTLSCDRCGYALAAEYYGRQLVGFGIQCIACKTITWAESWPDDEPLPAAVTSMGQIGPRAIGSTVPLPVHVTFTCDGEIARNAAATGPRPPRPRTIQLTKEGLEEFQLEFERLTGGMWFSSRIAAVERAILGGNKSFIKCPPAWAFVQLRRYVELGGGPPTEADRVAAAWLDLATYVIERWKHHELFPTFSSALVHDFHHTVLMLAIAVHLGDRQMRVGFSKEPKQGRFCDLYLQTTATERVTIEIKAPDRFYWPNPVPSRERIWKVLKKRLDSAGGQVGGGRASIAVVGGWQLDPTFSTNFKLTLQEFAARHQVSSRIAAVYGVVNRSLPPNVPYGEGFGDDQELHIWPELNPRYIGHNPFC